MVTQLCRNPLPALVCMWRVFMLLYARVGMWIRLLLVSPSVQRTQLSNVESGVRTFSWETKQMDNV